MFACGRGTNTRLDLTVREVHLSARESDFYLGGGMRLYKEQGSAPVLQEFDYEAQRAGSTLYTFTGLAETAYRGIYDSEAKRLLLFPGYSAGTFYLYDLAVPTSPALLWSGNIGVFAVMATDLRPGAVIFCSPSAETNMDTGGGVQWQMFTIDENDAVVPLDMRRIWQHCRQTHGGSITRTTKRSASARRTAFTCLRPTAKASCLRR